MRKSYKTFLSLGILAASIGLGYGAYVQVQTMIDTKVAELKFNEFSDSVTKVMDYNRTYDRSVRIEHGGSLGSGVQIEDDLVITARHVIFGDDLMNETPPEKITVFISGEAYEAVVEKNSRPDDLATLRMKKPRAMYWGHIGIACSNRIDDGNPYGNPFLDPREYYTVGNPYGQNMVSRFGHLANEGFAGLVGNPYDPVTHKSEFERIQSLFATRITLDMALQPGNSGGGLFNADHQLVGIISSVNVVPPLVATFAEQPLDVRLVGTYTYAIKASAVCRFLGEEMLKNRKDVATDFLKQRDEKRKS